MHIDCYLKQGCHQINHNYIHWWAIMESSALISYCDARCHSGRWLYYDSWHISSSKEELELVICLNSHHERLGTWLYEMTSLKGSRLCHDNTCPSVRPSAYPSAAELNCFATASYRSRPHSTDHTTNHCKVSLLPRTYALLFRASDVANRFLRQHVNRLPVNSRFALLSY